MSEHTPGPWVYNFNGHGFDVRQPAAALLLGSWIAETSEEANARLIAAAPDLLAVLEGQGHRPFHPHQTDIAADTCWHCGRAWPCPQAELSLCRICRDDWPCPAARAIAAATGEASDE